MVEIMETSLNPVLSLSVNRTVTKQINTICWRDSLGRGSGAGQDPRQIELKMVMLIGKVWNRGWGGGGGGGWGCGQFIFRKGLYRPVVLRVPSSVSCYASLPPPHYPSASSPPPNSPPAHPPPTLSIPPASTRAALAAPSAVLCE